MLPHFVLISIVTYLAFIDPKTTILLLTLANIILIIYALYHYRDILLWLKLSVGNDHYANLIDRLLHAMDTRSQEDTQELLVDFISFAQGTSRYRPTRYIGNDFKCPISHDTIHNGDMIMVLPCGHSGRYNSFKSWIDTNNTCPICRTRC